MTSFISLTDIYGHNKCTKTYPVVLFLLKELWIAILEGDLDDHSDSKNDERHVQDSEDSLASILVLKLTENLADLNEQEPFVVSIEGQLVQTVSVQVPVHEMAHETDHPGHLLLSEVKLDVD